MMNAIVFSGRRKPIEYKNYELSESAIDGRIKTEVLACSINRRDYWISKGLYPGINSKTKTILGSDAVVMYKGKQFLVCPNINWGEKNIPCKDYKILGLENVGTFADYLYTTEDKLYELPKHLSIEEGACIPLAGLTAYRTVITKCLISPGDKVLISGIGGGVATLAFLFSNAISNHVYVTSGKKAKIEKAKELGAMDGVLYSDEAAMLQLADKIGGFDVIIDSAGGEGFETLLRMCALGARVGIYGGTKGAIKRISAPNLFFKQISILGTTMGSDEEFGSMLDFVQKHKIRPIVDSVRVMKDGPSIIEGMGEFNQFGKIVLKNES